MSAAGALLAASLASSFLSSDEQPVTERAATASAGCRLDRPCVYRKLLRRIALIRNGPGAENVTFEFHPRWEPDPWAPAALHTGQ